MSSSDEFNLLILNCLPILEMSLSCSLSDSMFEQSESTMVSTWCSLTLLTRGPRLEMVKITTIQHVNFFLLTVTWKCIENSMENNYYYVHWLLGEDERKITGEKKLKQEGERGEFYRGERRQEGERKQNGIKGKIRSMDTYTYTIP